MKILFVLLCWLVVGSPAQAQAATVDALATKGSGALRVAANKTLPKKAEPAKPEEPPATIEGIEVSRRERGFMGVQIVNGTFKISFFDAKKKPMAPDMARAVLRWDPKYKVGKERVVLLPAEDGKSLASPRAIRPPYNFKLFITLIKDATESEEAVGETHVIDFRA